HAHAHTYTHTIPLHYSNHTYSTTNHTKHTHTHTHSNFKACACSYSIPLDVNAWLPHIMSVICLQRGTKCFVNTLAGFQHVARRVNKTSTNTHFTMLTK